MRKVVVSLLLWLLPLGALAGPQLKAPVWHEGQSWKVEAVYPRVTGGWSKPVLWVFEVVGAEDGRYLIEVRCGGELRARLYFERAPLCLRRVELFDRIRGKMVVRGEEFQGAVPAFPRHSPVPYHFPSFSDSGGGTFGDLHQEVTAVVEVPEEVRGLVEGAEGEGMTVVVRRGEKEVFRQLWFPSFPWAVWTEAGGIRAWLRP